MYSVKDPHMEIYNVCRKRDKSKEIQGPMRLKFVSSYDRIKSDLEVRSGLPGTQPHENWDVVPIIRRSTVSIKQQNNRATAANGFKRTNSMLDSGQQNRSASGSRDPSGPSVTVSQVFYVP